MNHFGFMRPKSVRRFVRARALGAEQQRQNDGGTEGKSRTRGALFQSLF